MTPYSITRAWAISRAPIARTWDGNSGPRQAMIDRTGRDTQLPPSQPPPPPV